jgi:hypothetical protein
MRINEYNLSPLFNKKKNKLIYKKYIYNLFKYNEEKRKKIFTNQNEEQKFNVLIKNIDTPKRNKAEKYSFLQQNTYEKLRLLNAVPKNLKKLNINVSHFREYSNKLLKNNNEIHKNCFTSRNTNKYAELIKSNFSSINGFLSNSTKKNKINLTDKCLFLRPISKKKHKIELLDKINETEYISNFSIFTKKEKNKCNKSYRITSSTCNKILNILNRNRIEKNLTRPTSTNLNKRIKLTYFKDVNDMTPRYRFTILKRELLRNEVKNNKLYIKSERSLSINRKRK